MSKSTELTVIETPKGFTREQASILADTLDPAHLKTRKQSGQELTYIEGWKVFERANEILGFDGWDRETVFLERTIGETYKKPGYNGGPDVEMFRAGYIAKVRITVRAGNTVIVREGTGYGQGVAKDPNQAFEGAVKEAETDAAKRAFMTLGNQFGLALYDKDKRAVATPDHVLRQQSAAVSASQVETLEGLISRTGTDKEKFLAFFKVASLGELPASQYERARSMLAKKLKGGAA